MRSRPAYSVRRAALSGGFHGGNSSLIATGSANAPDGAAGAAGLSGEPVLPLLSSPAGDVAAGAEGRMVADRSRNSDARRRRSASEDFTASGRLSIRSSVLWNPLFAVSRSFFA